MSGAFDDSPRAAKRQKLSEHEGPRQATTDTSLDSVEVDSPTQQDNTRQTRSSARQRRPPRRFEDEEITPSRTALKRAKQNRIAPQHGTVDAIRSETTSSTGSGGLSEPAATSPLKSILTPSKHHRSREGPPKNVVFDQDEAEIEQRLGFKDVDLSVKKARPAPYIAARKVVDGVNGLVLEHIEPEVRASDGLTQDNEEDPFDEQLAEPNFEDDENADNYVPSHNTSVTQEHAHLTNIKAQVLNRLTGIVLSTSPVPPHLKQAYKTLHDLLTATVSTSESNSILLLGPRGAGKTMLLEHAVSHLAKQHGSDSFYTVRLSGFLQTDDRLALREIWRQLGKELAVDASETDDMAASYADVLTSLLSLLSHPDDQLFEDENGVIQTNGEGRVAKSTIFVLDEFDLFTTHPRQTLLYNLFDIAQSRKAPIAVVGCSARMDVVDGLEKRVKSRFSQRWVFVPPVRSFGDWEEIVRGVVRVHTGRADIEMLKIAKDEQEWMEKWDEYIDKTLLPSTSVQALLRQSFYTTKSLPDLYMALYPIIATLDLTRADSTSSAIKPSPSGVAPPSLLSNLQTLPVLHMSLLIAHCRLETIHSLPTANFNLVYAHYAELVGRSRLQQSAAGAISVSGSLRLWGRDVARRAWEEVSDVGVLIGAGGGESEDTRMWRSEVGLEDVEWAVKKRTGGISSVLGKWCREV